MKSVISKIFTGLTVAMLASCYPAGPEYVADIDAVLTTFEKTYDFSTKSTYAMPDQIVVDAEKDLGGSWVPEYMNPIFADPILAQIEQNMTDNGWERVDIDEDPDVVLTPAAIKSTTYFYSYWYDWWYGGYWGWYYPPYYTVSSYTTGSMIMVISSSPENSPINQGQAVWIGVANGLVTGSYDINRVKKGIDQAFTQSPYLKLN
ncbi:MAG: DUF4136 domain-containing protein [Cyclobacteriaceae bacterium]|nr:DUF4136 domain-containing protein [Cyclobacteriaceae bacterium]